MEGLGNVLGPILSGGSAIGGTIGNIMEERKKVAYQNFIMDLLRHPEKLAAMAAKLTAPLNQGLQQSVGNQVQGSLAERGLSQAPGIYASSLAQGLAPYYQQNQQTAMNAVLQSLGMPQGTFGQPVNTSGAWQMFLNSLKKGGGGGGGNSGGLIGGGDNPGIVSFDDYTQFAGPPSAG